MHNGINTNNLKGHFSHLSSFSIIDFSYNFFSSKIILFSLFFDITISLTFICPAFISNISFF